MKTLKSLIILIILINFCTTKTFAQAGTLDPTFGENGLLVTQALTFNNRSIILEDGKILFFTTPNTLDKFNSDGTYDVSFGDHGRIVHNFNGQISDATTNFALQSDGKIICTAAYEPLTGDFYSCVYRCNPDGSLDSSFGYNGKDTVYIDKLNSPSGIVVQPDNKIVICGDVRKNIYDDKRTFIYRLMPDGGLDPSFGDGGIVVNKHSNDINSDALIITHDGKLIIGSTYGPYDDRPSYHLESFNPDGSVDAGFGNNGIAQFIFGQVQGGIWASEMKSMILQPDGKITCSGISGQDLFQLALCRFNTDGSTDESFGEGGGVITHFQDIQYLKNSDITLQPDGKILTTGFAKFGVNILLLIRYNTDGSLDQNFASDGIASVSNSPSSIVPTSVHVLADEKILVTGVTYAPPGSQEFIFLSRFNGDNVLAANFKDVKAFANKDAITITWQTLNESGTKSFTVERSGNASDYAGINTVPAKGVASSYSYTDKNPLDGISYYRIRENAANGTNTFSPVVKVVFNSTGVISLYPNPAKNTVTVKGLNKNSTAIIKITDMQGREISSQNFTQSSSAILNIRALAQGTYFVQVAQDNKVVRLKLIRE